MGELSYPILFGHGKRSARRKSKYFYGYLQDSSSDIATIAEKGVEGSHDVYHARVMLRYAITIRLNVLVINKSGISVLGN